MGDEATNTFSATSPTMATEIVATRGRSLLLERMPTAGVPSTEAAA
jgi:hypothetical protein